LKDTISRILDGHKETTGVKGRQKETSSDKNDERLLELAMNRALGSWAEYQLFARKVFRKHIYQEDLSQELRVYVSGKNAAAQHEGWCQGGERYDVLVAGASGAFGKR
jgi:hypothetical protein